MKKIALIIIVITSFMPLTCSTTEKRSFEQKCGMSDISGKPIFVVQNNMHYTKITNITYSPDGKFFLTRSSDGEIKLWNRSEILMRTFRHNKGRLANISFSRDGCFLRSQDRDTTARMRMWCINGSSISDSRIISSFVPFRYKNKYRLVYNNRTSGEVIKRKKKVSIPFRSREVSTFAFSPDEKYLIIGMKNGKLMIWEDGEKTLRQLGDVDLQPVNTIAVSPDGNTIAQSAGDFVRLWRKDGKYLGAVKVKKEDSSDKIMDLSITTDNKFIIMSLYSKVIVAGINSTYYNAVPCRYKIKDVTTDGRNIAYVSNRSIFIMPVNNSQPKKIVHDHDRSITAIKFTADNRYILYSDSEGNIVLCNIYGKKIRHISHSSVIKTYKTIFKEYSGYSLNCIDVSPGGSYFACGFDNGAITIWSVYGRLIRVIKDTNSIKGLAFNQSGAYIVSWYNPPGDSLHYRDNQYLLHRDELKIWKINGNLHKQFTNSSNSILSAAFHPMGRHLFMGQKNGSIKVLNINEGTQLSMLSDGRDWVMYNPDGYFDSSRRGSRLLAVVNGVSTYGLEQFALENNRPDLMMEKIGFSNKKLIAHFYRQFQKRLRNFGIDESDLSRDMHVPDVEIISKKVKKKYLYLKFKLFDSKYNLRSYNIYINGVPVYGRKGRKYDSTLNSLFGKKIKGKKLVLKDKVNLDYGKNKIELSCFNEKGAESYRKAIYVEYKKRSKGTLYFLGFGISRYKDPTLNLKYANNDVKDLSAVFSKMKRGYQKIHIKTFTDNEVTIKNIKHAYRFLGSLEINDTVVFFIAGHGLHVNNDNDLKYYFLPYNTDLKRITETAVNFEVIENILFNCKARKKVLLIDTCESGEVNKWYGAQYSIQANARGLHARTSRSLKVLYKKNRTMHNRFYSNDRDRYIYIDLIRKSGAIVISSSQGSEFSFEHDRYKNGLFTEAILEGLTSSKADRNKDGFVSKYELDEYIRKRVPQISNNLQHPSIYLDNVYQDLRFPVVR